MQSTIPDTSVVSLEMPEQTLTRDVSKERVDKLLLQLSDMKTTADREDLNIRIGVNFNRVAVRLQSARKARKHDTKFSETIDWTQYKDFQSIQ